ncbi:MAG: hypothetical protein ABSC73_09565 [Acidimicrobiales bacterium]|jgi:ribosome maturation factor RimP
MTDVYSELVEVVMKTINEWFPSLSATEDGAIDVEDCANLLAALEQRYSDDKL